MSLRTLSQVSFFDPEFVMLMNEGRWPRRVCESCRCRSGPRCLLLRASRQQQPGRLSLPQTRTASNDAGFGEIAPASVAVTDRDVYGRRP